MQIYAKNISGYKRGGRIFLMKIEPIKCKTALSPSKLPGLRYSLNPYLGCAHGCLYCYSPAVLGDARLAMSWGKAVFPKENILDVLAREVKKKPKGTVGMSTVTDPYQPLEEKLELTRKCIEILSANGFPISIQTKSKLLLRDIELLRPGAFDVGVTITTMVRELARDLEPGASLPDERARILKEVSAKGVETWLFLGPIIPGVNDDEAGLREVISVAAETSSRVIYDKLNLKRWVLDRLSSFLRARRPDLVERLPSLVAHGSKTWEKISARVEGICRSLRVDCEPAFAPR
ncbi:MAG: radical SAM protein [Candidatus Hadarchaeales archaeon]